MEPTYGGSGVDEAFSVVQASDGGYAIVGYTSSFGAGNDDFWLVKVAPAPILLGDINSDGIVDIFDVVSAALAFGSTPGDSNWNQAADLNNDGVVDIFDIVLIATNFGETA